MGNIYYSKLKEGKEDSILVSIIIPIYNGECYISDCYRYIAAQTYKNIEIIFINDGSTDNTKRVLEDFVRKDNRIIFIDKVNGGVSSARNAGVEVAHGEYITFMDVDDYISENFVELLLNDALKLEVDIVICRCIRSYMNKDNRNESDKYYESLKNKVFEDANQYYSCFYNKHSVMTFHSVWGKLYKTNVLKKHKFNIELNYYEDTVYLYELFSKSPKTYFEPQVCYNHISWDSSSLEVALKGNNSKKKKKLDADWAKCYLIIYKCCCDSCDENIISMATKDMESKIFRILFNLVSKKEKNFYKTYNSIIKYILKNIETKSLAKKFYYKVYLFNSKVCWYFTKLLLVLQHR